MQVTLRKGLFLFSFLYLFGIGISASLAGIIDDDPLTKATESKDITNPQVKSDSTDVPDEAQPQQPYDVEPELGSLNGDSDLPEVDETPVEIPERTGYYDDGEEEGEESSKSIISFNFLYYLLQKFKFSNSLGY